MIEDISTNELKCYHARPDAHAQIVLEEPHAWIADNKSALPSDVIFQIPVHRRLLSVLVLTYHLLVCSRPRHVYQVYDS